ncbi:MAG TPA: P-loop NTPase [Syntrophales bacterium]|nr:P-loop NTPase [Syntrophales bacterium]
MIPIHDINAAEFNRLRVACAYLFSLEHAKNTEFLRSLNPVSVKKAFRDKAKRYHPDLHIHESKEMLYQRKERFLKIQESYEHLNNYFRENPITLFAQGAGRGDIIAVGGAKGGIGKSIFAVNLAILLSSIGSKTVLIDLDLGGANLHLYLGETALKGTINDFLNKTVPDLQDIAILSKYGPLLIGGDSSQLGAANISFNQKLRLLKAIKQIEADYVILDLGGDTSFNIIDFFLAADYGIILTTCDPASYLEAYNFLKVALYRKLYRIFGTESEFNERKNSELEYLIQEFILRKPQSSIKTIQNLLALVKEKHPSHLSLINEVVSTYHPNLAINRVTDQCNVNEVVERIKLISKKMLSVNVKYLGSIPYQPEIEVSVRELIPVVAKYPQGVLAKKARNFLNKFLKC